MFGRLLLLFIVVPILDLSLLLFLSQYITWPVTILCIIVSGIVGAWLAKRSSSAVLGRIREELGNNRMAAGLLTDGAMIFFAAGLLITPGIITDLLGFSLLIPACRSRYKKLIAGYVKRHVTIVVPGTPLDPNVVDGEVTATRSAGEKSRKDYSSDPGIESAGPVIDGSVRKHDIE